jgi:NO-binding membrane sensor protein with MHYT domain
MFAGHDPFLVALSVAVAILGGYTGFGIAARIRTAPHANPRLLLTGAAAFLAIGIWTMHFVGMLAAPIPADASYLVLPTVISFLLCALVVGISLFFVSIGKPSEGRVSASALLLGLGIASMHYVGIHGLAGDFSIQHDYGMLVLSVAIAVAAAYGGLKIYLARQGGLRLALSAIAFGIAVSGMHYTAMYGMHFVPAAAGHHREFGGLVASPQLLSLAVALLCFVIAAGFLLFLVPEQRQRLATLGPDETDMGLIDLPADPHDRPPRLADQPASRALPLGGIGQPKQMPVSRIPVVSTEGTLLIDISDIRSIRADAHYTLIHDGQRERMCPWSISEAEARLDPALFTRVHRSHIVALPHVSFLRKEGDGAIIELDGAVPHVVPVSRAKIAEVKARLGLVRRAAMRQ